MEDSKLTLTDIAKKANVAVSTVHKALYNKQGVSDKKRQYILDIAESFNYNKGTSTYYKDYRFAAVFPKPVGGNKYFYQYLWDGIHRRSEELKEYSITVEDFHIEDTIDQHYAVLEQILHSKTVKYNAVITSVWKEEKVIPLIQEMRTAGIDFFAISATTPQSQQTAAITPNHFKTGCLAAEYLGAVLPRGSRAVIIGTRRDMVNHDKTVKGFYTQMLETNPDVEIIELYDSGKSPEKLYSSLRELIQSLDNIRGIYTNNARTTAAVCEVLSDLILDRKIFVIGSELFEDSKKALREGVLDAIIDQGAFQLGYSGISTAFDVVSLSKTVSQEIITPVSFILRNSLLDTE